MGYSNTSDRHYYFNCDVDTPDVFLTSKQNICLGNKFKMHSGGLPLGVSIGDNNTMGTLGFFVSDPQGNIYGVTDAHVIQNMVTVYSPSGVAVFSPQYYGNSAPAIKPVQIGSTYYVTPVVGNVDIDFGLIKIDPGITPINYVYGVGVPQFLMPADFLENVIKVGARTGVTIGYVVDRSVTVPIETDTGNEITFTGTLFFLRTLPGDSGSPIYESGGSIVGTVEGGNGIYCVGNSADAIANMLKKLGLKLYFPHNSNLSLFTFPVVTFGFMLSTLL